jgi:hypothetical protein
MHIETLWSIRPCRFESGRGYQIKGDNLLKFLRVYLSREIVVSHIPYTICRSGIYYYNRRVPKHAVKAYGLFIRQALSKCPEEAEACAKRLGDVLEGSWRRTTERVQPSERYFYQ